MEAIAHFRDGAVRICRTPNGLVTRPRGTVRDYPPAKTAADRFKLRNKIGVDVALEALRECRSLQKASMDLERMLFRRSKSKPAYFYPERRSPVRTLHEGTLSCPTRCRFLSERRQFSRALPSNFPGDVDQKDADYDSVGVALLHFRAWRTGIPCRCSRRERSG